MSRRDLFKNLVAAITGFWCDRNRVDLPATIIQQQAPRAGPLDGPLGAVTTLVYDLNAWSPRRDDKFSTTFTYAYGSSDTFVEAPDLPFA
jgi:hypothetical protein